MALSMDTSLPLSAVVQARSSLSADAAPRHLDPRVSLAVLVMINVQMALTQSLFAEMGVLALTVVVMAYCRRFSAIVRWLAFYALFAVTAQLFVASGNTLLSPFAASLLMYRHVLPAFMFAFNMIATTRLGELACALQATHVPCERVGGCVRGISFPPHHGTRILRCRRCYEDARYRAHAEVGRAPSREDRRTFPCARDRTFGPDRRRTGERGRRPRRGGECAPHLVLPLEGARYRYCVSHRCDGAPCAFRLL